MTGPAPVAPVTAAPAMTIASVQAEIAALESGLTPDQKTRLEYVITTAEQFAVVQITAVVNSKLESFKVMGVSAGHFAEGYIDGLINQAGIEFVSIVEPATPAGA